MRTSILAAFLTALFIAPAGADPAQGTRVSAKEEFPPFFKSCLVSYPRDPAGLQLVTTPELLPPADRRGVDRDGFIEFIAHPNWSMLGGQHLHSEAKSHYARMMFHKPRNELWFTMGNAAYYVEVGERIRAGRGYGPKF